MREILFLREGADGTLGEAEHLSEDVTVYVRADCAAVVSVTELRDMFAQSGSRQEGFRYPCCECKHSADNATGYPCIICKHLP